MYIRFLIYKIDEIINKKAQKLTLKNLYFSQVLEIQMHTVYLVFYILNTSFRSQSAKIFELISKTISLFLAKIGIVLIFLKQQIG